MGKATKRKKKPAIIEAFDKPTDAQLASGGYELTRTPDPEGGNRIAPTYINRGGTPIARWKHAQKLSDTQALAIATCLRLWGITATEPKTTAAYGETIRASNDHESQSMIEMRIEAAEDLKRIRGYFNGLEAWWSVFEGVCRWDEPAGVAGSKLGFGNRSGEDRAHTVVCMVADVIATREGLVPVTRILVG